jgi:hypothetical protein
MRLVFTETIPLPAATIHSYFQTSADWVRLYGFAGQVRQREGGWYAVPLQRFPFPLTARITANEPPQLVRWEFRGFWRGGGEIRLTEVPGGTRVEGFEDITARWLPGLSLLLERLFMEREFRRIWALGWRRLRKQAEHAESGRPADPTPE